MAFCGLCRYIPWLNARERHRYLVIQPSTTSASAPDLDAARPDDATLHTSSTPEATATRLDDAKVHTSLGSELQGELRRGHRHSLGSDVDVYRGSWVQPNGEESQVAIKILRPFARNGDEHSTNERLRKRLLRQSSIWQGISHPNILPFLGYRLGEDPCIILPWCNDGNLSLYLTDRPELMRTGKITLLHQAALGIQYLHARNPSIVHGNICPNNVLINDQNIAVVSDFNLSQIIEERTGITTTGMRNEANRYLAPEHLTADKPVSSTVAADVYAFGGLILTTMSGLPPHHHILGVGTFILAVITGAVPTPYDHPTLPESDPLWEWMRRCWAFEPTKRPPMDEIVNMLAIQANDGKLDDGSYPTVSSPVREVMPTDDPDPDIFTLVELPGDLIRETEPGLEKTLNGGFADVVRGRWTPPGGTTCPVAIKYLRTVGIQSTSTQREKVARVNKRVDREVIVWRALRSPYILELYGFRSGEQPCLVSPWCNNGTLTEYLEAHRLSDADKLHLLAQAGKGLQYLHEYKPPISHGDIKPSNILIDDSNCPRLCDFGLSQFLGEINPELLTSFVGQGSKGYQSPELVRDGVQDLPGDVYAFGCLILEIMSGNAPFYKLKAQKAILVTTAGSTPEPSAHPDLPATDPLWGIMRKCWASPASRPAIQELVQLLEAEVNRRRSTAANLA